MKKLFAALLVTALLVAGCGAAKQVEKVSPEKAAEMTTKATELLRQGQMQEAKPMIETASKSDPKNLQAQFLAGIVAYNDKKYDVAIEAYNKVIALDPNFVEAYNNLGNTYRDMQKLDEAIKWYTKAAEVAPTFTYAYTNHALMLEQNGKAAEGAVVLEAGVKANPSNLDLKLTLAGMYLRTGNKEKAKAIVDDILKTNPGFPAAVALQKEIEGKK